MGLAAGRRGAGLSSARRRTIGAVALTAVLAICACALSAASAGAAPKLPKGPKIDTARPCTILGQRQLASFFEPKVTLDETNQLSPLTTDCAWIVGDPAAPEGRLVATVLYPGFTAPGQNAVGVVDDDRANAQLSGTGVVDLSIGKSGFLAKPRSVLEVAPSKRFAFSLQWYPAGGAPDGSPITRQIRALLTTLATDAAKRGKDVS
jgi:hypothetical protein